MEKAVFQAPGLYADHHVTEVRQQLFSLPGVAEIYASSTFFVIEVTYDETLVTADLLKSKIGEMGYFDEIQASTENWLLSESGGANASFRRSASYETLKKTMSFQQPVRSNGRPLWNCPGIGMSKSSDN